MKWPTHIVAATGYVFNERDELLMVKLHHRGWDATGGQVEVGESIEEGVLREIMEESGITATVRSLVGVYSNVGVNVAHDGVTPVPTKLILEFICDYVSGEPTTSDENNETKWVPRGEALALVTSPARRSAFEKMLAFDGRACYASYVTQPSYQLLSERYI
ncbi:MAG: NUDIX hydrolase [Defluviitaleaceae bacterium]|nr:NUDIX hydrolase [Defluviitaleaceae bacterium]